MGKLSQKKQAMAEQVVRESIHEAVLEVLSSQGLEKLTMQQVATEAGIATGTLYNYFKDKDAVLVYTAQRLFEQIRELLSAVADRELGAKAKLTEMILTEFEFFHQNMPYFQFLDQAQIFCKMDTSIKREHLREEIGIIRRVIEQGIAEEVFEGVDPETTADFFHRAIVGTLCVRPEVDAFDPNVEAKSLVRMFMSILEPRKET